MTIDNIELDRMEQEIRDHDTGTIHHRWEFGRTALSDPELTDQDGRLKRDGADALITALAKAARNCHGAKSSTASSAPRRTRPRLRSARPARSSATGGTWLRQVSRPHAISLTTAGRVRWRISRTAADVRTRSKS